MTCYLERWGMPFYLLLGERGVPLDIVRWGKILNIKRSGMVLNLEKWCMVLDIDRWKLTLNMKRWDMILNIKWWFTLKCRKIALGSFEYEVRLCLWIEKIKHPVLKGRYVWFFTKRGDKIFSITRHQVWIYHVTISRAVHISLQYCEYVSIVISIHQW